MIEYPPGGIVWVAGNPPVDTPTASPAKVAVFNAQTLAAAEWSPAWTDVAAVGGVLYGMGPAGIEVLSGPLEAGATPLVQTGKMNLAPGHTCNIHPAHGLIQASRDITLTATADDDGKVRSLPHRILGRDGPQERKRTISLAQGMMGSAWQFMLSSVGVQWSISSLDVMVNRKQRRK